MKASWILAVFGSCAVLFFFGVLSFFFYQGVSQPEEAPAPYEAPMQLAKQDLLMQQLLAGQAELLEEFDVLGARFDELMRPLSEAAVRRGDGLCRQGSFMMPGPTPDVMVVQAFEFCGEGEFRPQGPVYEREVDRGPQQNVPEGVVEH